MKANHILSFTFFTLNIVWGKPRGGGAPASWLIKPLVVDLAPTGCTVVRPAHPFELPPVRYARCTKVLGSSPNLLPLLDKSDVCALSYELFPEVIE